MWNSLLKAVVGVYVECDFNQWIYVAVPILEFIERERVEGSGRCHIATVRTSRCVLPLWPQVSLWTSIIFSPQFRYWKGINIFSYSNIEYLISLLSISIFYCFGNAHMLIDRSIDRSKWRRRNLPAAIDAYDMHAMQNWCREQKITIPRERNMFHFLAITQTIHVHILNQQWSFQTMTLYNG